MANNTSFYFFENKIILFKTSTLVSILTGGILDNFRIMFQLIWRSNAKVIKETTKQKRLNEKKKRMDQTAGPLTNLHHLRPSLITPADNLALHVSRLIFNLQPKITRRPRPCADFSQPWFPTISVIKTFPVCFYKFSSTSSAFPLYFPNLRATRLLGFELTNSPLPLAEHQIPTRSDHPTPSLLS
jgi:hypothetical protein